MKQDDIYFVSENTGWYVNGYGKIFKTTDGGKSWKTCDLGRACNKIRIIKKPDGSYYGYAIGVNVFKLSRK